MTFTYTGIRVRDLDRSIAFYCSLLGLVLRKRRDVPETGGAWASLLNADGPGELELNYYPEGSTYYEPYARGTELDHLCFECFDTDVEVTRRIREALTVDHALSTNGQNIKIVTLNGRTTLRGPVKDAKEQAHIVKKATEIVGPSNVVNQLEVTSP